MFGLNSRDNEHGRGAEALSLPTPRFAGGAIGRGGIFGNTRKPRLFFTSHTINAQEIALGEAV